MKKIIFLVFLSTILNAQFISVKSIPVATGDQFVLFPSQNISMGGVNIALNDDWLDPFINPAKGSRISELSFFVQPTFYNTTGNLGGGLTLPITSFFKKKNWFAISSFAYQQIEGARLSDRFNLWQSTQPIKKVDYFHTNQYLFINFGKKLSSSGFSIAGSFFTALLDALGGVDLLYNRSKRIEQKGNLHQLKAGLTYEDKLAVFETILLFSNYDMLHKVYYDEWIWNKDLGKRVLKEREEKNLDKTDTWGIHFAYKQNPDKNGLSLGAIATFNWKTHPKIPNYDIMRIPRDPGNTWAYNFGVGAAISKQGIRIGLDFIFEPIWSNTWAAAEEEIVVDDTYKILPGQKTIENDFTFNNWLTKFGVHKSYETISFSTGVELYQRSYNLIQQNYTERFTRHHNESWLDFTWSWGLELKFKYFNFKYFGRRITGAGVPRINNGFRFDESANFAKADLIIAPAGVLNIDMATTLTHQFIVQIPIGVKK